MSDKEYAAKALKKMLAALAAEREPEKIDPEAFEYLADLRRRAT